MSRIAATYKNIRRARTLPVLILPWLLAACADTVFIQSTNHSSRVDHVVIHATSEDFAESVRLLTTRTDRPVSSHYLIPAENDPTYNHRRLRLHQFVDEDRSAWHSGPSYWAGITALNSRSIGIEIVNDLECRMADENASLDSPLDSLECEFFPFSEAQIDMLIELLRGILQRYPEIGPLDVVAHSDVIIMYRSDPGPLFPWRRLYEEGIGAWYEQEAKVRYESQFTAEPPSIEKLQAALLRLGYQVQATGELDNQTRFAVRAMQLRFRPGDYSGEPDAETLAILWSLLEKYRRGDPR